jgi:superfamily II DNA or RNA helicase
MQATGIRAEREKAEHSASLTATSRGNGPEHANRLDKFAADHFGLVIADEADKSISKQWQKVLNHFDGSAKVAGFTATPHRTDQKNLGCYYENVVERENLIQLNQQRFSVAGSMS